MQVAAVSGDVRRCLELLRRSAEITAAQAKQARVEAQAAEQSQAPEVPPSQLPDQAQGQGRRHGKARGQGQNQTPAQQLEVAQPGTDAQAPPPSGFTRVTRTRVTVL